MALVPTREEGLSLVQLRGARTGPLLSSEAGKEGDPAFMGHSHVPSTVPGALSMSWGVSVVGAMFRRHSGSPKSPEARFGLHSPQAVPLGFSVSL